MNPADIALIAENIVILAGIGAGWHLLRQGGGLQVKAPPPPKAPSLPQPGTVQPVSPGGPE